MRLIKSSSITLHGETSPIRPEAIVTEQDTWLALAPSPDVLLDDANPLRTHTRAHDAEPLRVGTVDLVHTAGRPALVRAIVIDVDAEPSCTAQFVEEAMSAAIVACRARGIRSMRVPLLGTAHGRLAADESACAIERAILSAAPGEPLDIVLLK